MEDYSNDTSVEKVLRPIIDNIKAQFFTAPSSTSDEEAMGLLIDKFFAGNGQSTLEACALALESCNYHRESALVLEIIEKHNL